MPLENPTKRKVISLKRNGLDQQQIAIELGLSIKTVHQHLKRSYVRIHKKKTNVKKAPVHFVIKKEVVEPDIIMTEEYYIPDFKELLKENNL